MLRGVAFEELLADLTASLNQSPIRARSLFRSSTGSLGVLSSPCRHDLADRRQRADCSLRLTRDLREAGLYDPAYGDRHRRFMAAVVRCGSIRRV